MAYLREIVRPKCSCGKWATHQLCNVANGSCGDWCGPCGRRELKRLMKSEKEWWAGRARETKSGGN